MFALSLAGVLASLASKRVHRHQGQPLGNRQEQAAVPGDLG
jgi:hypothetical protein